MSTVAVKDRRLSTRGVDDGHERLDDVRRQRARHDHVTLVIEGLLLACQLVVIDARVPDVGSPVDSRLGPRNP